MDSSTRISPMRSEDYGQRTEEDISGDSESHPDVVVSKKSRVVEKDALGREKIEPVGDSFLYKSGILKSIHKTIHAHYDGPWRSFSKVPVPVVELWWSEFQHQYFWEPHHGPTIKRNWRIKCGSHIRGTFNAAVRKGYVPKCVRAQHWNQILEEMRTCEKYKRICAINKSNRASKKYNGNANYAGGSKSAAEYAQEFEEKHGREITQDELMRITYHSKRLGRWTGERPKKATETYEEKCKNWLESHEELSKEDSLVLWSESVGGEHKRRLFGKGSLYFKTDYVLNPPARGASPPARGASPMSHGPSPPARGPSPPARGPSPPARGPSSSSQVPSSQQHLASSQMPYGRGISTSETQRTEAILQARYQELKAYEERLRRKEMQMSQNLHPNVSSGMQFQSLLMNGDSNLFGLTDEPLRRNITSFGSQPSQFSDFALADPFPLFSPRS